MKKFISTPFFRKIKTDPHVLLSSVEAEYDAFALLLFKESSRKSSQNEKLACYSALIYTHTEFASLLEVSEKKAHRQL
jgi:hypothetical protein